MTGIYDCFGYGPGYDVSFSERYRLIKDAGFDCVMLWWSDKFGRGEEYPEDADLARDAGLRIENIHTPVYGQNDLSLDNLQGDHVLHVYLKCVEDCHTHEIPAAVIHLPADEFPPDHGSGLRHFHENDRGRKDQRGRNADQSDSFF